MEDDVSELLTRGDRLLHRVARGGGGKVQNDLLSAFYHGYPIERLRVLLASDRSPVVAAAVWLAWELPDHIAPVIRDIAPLVLHRHNFVRFWAVRVVLLHQGAVPAEFTALAVSRLRDRTRPVRASVVNGLARADLGVLERCVEHLSDRETARDVGWLLGRCRARDPERAVSRALSSDSRSRRLAAIAMASRLAAIGRPRLLERVAASADFEEALLAEVEMPF